MKGVQIRSFFLSVFSCIRNEYRDLLRIQDDTDQKKLHIWTLFTQWPSLPNIQKTSCFHICFEKNHLAFCNQRKNILFSRKRNAIFTGDTRKFIFQFYFLNLFETKTRKENMVFRAVHIACCILAFVWLGLYSSVLCFYNPWLFTFGIFSALQTIR